jgi:glycosyltransferase involved in cell wall biosynthesis
MRLCHVVETLGRGGAERALVNLLPELIRNGHECDVAVLWPPYTLAAELRAKGVLVHRLEGGHRWNLLSGCWSLVKFARARRHDVIHVHSYFPLLHAGLVRGLLPQARVVATFHNLGFDAYPVRSHWRRFRRWLQSWVARKHVDAVIAVSGAVARHYVKHLRLDTVKVLPNPVLITGVDELPSRDQVQSLRCCRLIVAGRLVPEKGHAHLLRALQELRERGVFPKLLIVGDGPLRERIESMVSDAGLHDQVDLVPAVPHEELLRLVRNADIMVVPSTHEGWPLTPAEAMALGRPVIASDVGGISEMIEHEVSGLLVRPGDPSALAAAILRLAGDDRLRRDLGAAGQDRIKSCCLPSAIAERLLAIYRDLPQRTRASDSQGERG